jgi:hypothetical protein
MSVDGMIEAAPTTALAESRSDGRGWILPRALLVAGSAASLTAKVAVAEPAATGRVIAAWPSFALIASYELLMRPGPPAPPRPPRPGSGPAGSAADPNARHRPAGAVFSGLTPGRAGLAQPGSPGAGVAVGAGQPGR